MQLPVQTLYWILVTIGLFVVMFILVPPKQGPELSRFGFWFGIIMGLVILGIGQNYNLFRIVGDPDLFGIPIMSTLSWMPIVIIFAKFFTLADTKLKITGYVVLFALGSALAQYLQELMGMWESIRWNVYYTFLLGISTHSLMAGYLIFRHRNTLIK